VTVQRSVADRWRAVPPAVRTFALGFATTALLGLAMIGAGLIGGSPSESELPKTLSRLLLPVGVAGLALGIVAARRGLRAWFAGFVGAVLGVVPVIVAYGLDTTGSLTEILVSGAIIASLVVFAPIIGLSFLLAGGLTFVARRLRGTPDGP
jgi:hypothetical protein